MDGHISHLAKAIACKVPRAPTGEGLFVILKTFSTIIWARKKDIFGPKACIVGLERACNLVVQFMGAFNKPVQVCFSRS
jgi:hypothetical protein